MIECVCDTRLHGKNSYMGGTAFSCFDSFASEADVRGSSENQFRKQEDIGSEELMKSLIF